jgi:hypothetical protein
MAAILSRAHNIVLALPLYPVMIMACVDCGARWKRGEPAGRCRRKGESLSSGWSGAIVDHNGQIIGLANRAGPARHYRIKIDTPTRHGGA